jgi:hypothetical protein
MMSSHPTPYALTRLLSLKAGATMRIHGIDDPAQSSAGVRKGNVPGLRDKSTDGVWSYDVENEGFSDTTTTSVRGSFRQKRKDINGQSAIARTFMGNPRP